MNRLPACVLLFYQLHLRENMDHSIKNFLVIGKLEGYSYLLLLLVAMPLKYLANIPQAVRIAGTIHGLLFIAFMACIVILLNRKHFNFKQAFQAFILSIVPFGTFFLKKIL